MHAVILAAGYATRMYPLTADRPKSLLPVGRRVVLDWMMDGLQALPAMRDITLVTNAKFEHQFADWLRARSDPKPVRLVNDGSTTDENRLGSIRDMLLAIEHARLTAPLLITAGDHIVEWNLHDFCAFGHAHEPYATIALYRLPDPRDATRYGIADVAADGRIIHCEEKPRQPRSNLAAVCLYYFPPAVWPRLRQYLTTGLDADAPGHFIVWLHQQEPIYGWQAEGRLFDIGTVESYERTCHALEGAAA